MKPFLSKSIWPTILFLIAASVPRVVATKACCQILSQSFNLKVSFPNTAEYNATSSSYWSAREQSIYPSCYFHPLSAQDVSNALGVLISKQCKFAVRGGGHGPLGGLANTLNAVTIDMRGIDSIRPFANNTLVAVGSGQTIGNLYAALAPLGITVSGGRSYDVGVGGSTLGDGWGWMSNEVGFSCDNVVQYEVVLADGKIVTATNATNPDLFRALKGSGSNLGIVTEFVYRTLPMSKIWTAEIVWSFAELGVQHLLSAAYNFARNPFQDRKASLLYSFSYNPLYGVSYLTQCVYTAPVPVVPPAFVELVSLPGQMLQSNISVTTLPEFSLKFNSETPNNLQQISFALTMENDLETLTEFHSLWNTSIATVSEVEDLSWTLDFQPLTSLMTNASEARGGNLLGIGPAPPQGLLVAIMTASFTQAHDYELVSRAADDLLEKCIAAAKAHNVYRPWVDMNHASWKQDPIASYGHENKAYLLTVADQYDTGAVFQTLMPGGFKLNGGFHM
ncbi:FAD-binding domain-containing protein [Xylaria scruposa]|nr:FAD-binding domain-containing protein [Xylaria scruposa]